MGEWFVNTYMIVFIQGLLLQNRIWKQMQKLVSRLEHFHPTQHPFVPNNNNNISLETSVPLNPPTATTTIFSHHGQQSTEVLQTVIKSQN